MRREEDIVNKPPALLRSAFWAAVVSIPLCFLGASSSMGLAHSGGPLLLLFLPVLPVLFLFGSGGYFGEAPDWLFYTLAMGAEFLGAFFLIHAIRLALARRTDDDA